MKRYLESFNGFSLNEEIMQPRRGGPIDQLCRGLAKPGSLSPKMMMQLLEAGADPNGHDDRGNTPLKCAIASGDPGAVEMLLEYGANPNQKFEVGRVYMTPLEFTGYILSRERHDDRSVKAMVEIIKLLSKAGAE